MMLGVWSVITRTLQARATVLSFTGTLRLTSFWFSHSLVSEEADIINDIFIFHLSQWRPWYVCTLHWEWSMDHIIRLWSRWFVATVVHQWTSFWVLNKKWFALLCPRFFNHFILELNYSFFNVFTINRIPFSWLRIFV